MAEPELVSLPQMALAVVTGKLGVLVGHHLDGTSPWTFPGVRIEPGESPEQAVVREVEVETGPGHA